MAAAGWEKKTAMVFSDARWKPRIDCWVVGTLARKRWPGNRVLFHPDNQREWADGAHT